MLSYPRLAEAEAVVKEPSPSWVRSQVAQKESSQASNADRQFYCFPRRPLRGRIECGRCSAGRGKWLSLACFLSLRVQLFVCLDLILDHVSLHFVIAGPFFGGCGSNAVVNAERNAFFHSLV